MNERFPVPGTTVRLLQVGMGDWGRFWVRRALPQLPEIELAGCVDPDPRALAVAREQLGASARRGFPSLEAGLAATSPGAVLPGTTLAAHCPAATASLHARAPVLAENPLAPTRA